MMQSSYPLEQDLGMRYYGSDIPGIGGRLRTHPEDFIVEEIPVKKGGTSGPYLICTLTKTNWELQHAVKEIAKRLGISHRRIGWAGTKDRNAVTKQQISIYDVTPEQVAAVRLKDLVLEPAGSSNESLLLGDLQGNRFEIMIRDTESRDLSRSVEEIARTAAEGIPNYFGIQRFGALRPVTHRVGECILKGNYKQAVLTYIGMVFSEEPETTRGVRSDFMETHDIEAALHRFPVQLSYERAMLHYLIAHPGDYAGALHELPPKLLSMFVSAFQSYLFNCALSRRFDDGHTMTDPVPGNLLVFANGRTDIATATNLPAVSLHIRRGRCSIALFMPGKDTGSRQSCDSTTLSLLAERGITQKQFEEAAKFVRTKFEGAYRPISLAASIESQIEERNVRLKFSLPPGHYATTVCREFMKADPQKMV